MWLYVWDKELKELYIGNSKIKEAYVGSELVRPTWWHPSSNTLAYYPFADNQLDSTWKTTLPISWTRQTIWYMFTCGSRENWYINNTKSAKTLSCWAYINNPGSNSAMLELKTLWYCTASPNTNVRNKLQWQASNGSWFTLGNAFSVSWWNLFTFIYTWTAVYWYLNAELKWTWQYTLIDVNCVLWHLVTITLSELIIEDKARTRQDIINYYNKTKSLYWL